MYARTRRRPELEWCGEGRPPLYMCSPSEATRWRRVGCARARCPIGGGRGAPANGGAAEARGGGGTCASAPGGSAASSAICPASVPHRSVSRQAKRFFAQFLGLSTFELSHCAFLKRFHIFVQTCLLYLEFDQNISSCPKISN